MKHGVTVSFAELRFLVVEDQGFQRWVMEQLLREIGAGSVLSAKDGNDALDICRGAQPPIDIVVSDLNMPGMDGMEFIRHLREVSAGVSVILASDLDRSLVASVEAMTQAYGMTLLGAIQKPVTSSKLAAVIRRFSRSMRPNAPSAMPNFGPAEVLEGIRRGEFEPYFQAKVEIVTHAIVGAEALARWRHGTFGTLRPAAFIQALESGGEVGELTLDMLSKATQSCAGWRAGGLDATVSLNLSVSSLADDWLAQRMVEIVASRGLEPRHVVLEVTETASATNLGKVLETLSRLRLKGFGLSIDDYGTGYSSMKQLSSIAFTELKIDRAFVRNADTQPACRAVLESSLEMASKLGLTAVAEGVETIEQLDLLRELGCDQAQGYFFAKPMPASEFVEWAGDPDSRLAPGESRLQRGGSGNSR